MPPDTGGGERSLVFTQGKLVVSTVVGPECTREGEPERGKMLSPNRETIGSCRPCPIKIEDSLISWSYTQA